MKNLHGLEFGALLHDLLGVAVGGLVDLQQPGGLRQRPQRVDGVGALEVLVLQPLLQVTDVAPEQNGTDPNPPADVDAQLHGNRRELSPDLHPFPAGTHVFAQHDVVQGDGPHQVEELLHGLVDQPLRHAVLAHGGMEGAELLNDGGDGGGVGVLVSAVGSLPEARRLHAGNPLKTLVLQHARHCRKRGCETQRLSAPMNEDALKRPYQRQE